MHEPVRGLIEEEMIMTAVLCKCSGPRTKKCVQKIF